MRLTAAGLRAPSITKKPRPAGRPNFGAFLAKEVEAAFQPGRLTIADQTVCEKRLSSLDHLLNNEVLKGYPHKYSSGVFGMKLEDLQKASSEESRKQMGLKPKVSIFKKFSGQLFSKKDK
uniref:Uncharacterized protein n=1 Tax=Caenorhabditis japonica TaxID=281687 RepID=A0A8R1DP39_CAEJA